MHPKERSNDMPVGRPRREPTRVEATLAVLGMLTKEEQREVLTELWSQFMGAPQPNTPTKRAARPRHVNGEGKEASHQTNQTTGHITSP